MTNAGGLLIAGTPKQVLLYGFDTIMSLILKIQCILRWQSNKNTNYLMNNRVKYSGMVISKMGFVSLVLVWKTRQGKSTFGHVQAEDV